MKLNQHTKQGEQLQKNGEEIIKIARKYGIFELDLLKAIDEVNALPKVELGHPQQEAQSITVKPDTASVSANRASAGNRSNQKLTEVSSELEPQQQESWQYELIKRFTSPGHPHVHTIRQMKLDHEEIGELIAFISTERQRVIEEVRGLVEGKKRDVRLKDGCGFCKSTDEKPCNCDPWNSALDDLLQALKEMEDKTL